MAKQHSSMEIGSGWRINMGSAPLYPLTPQQAMDQKSFASSAFMGDPLTAGTAPGYSTWYELAEIWCPPLNRYFHDNS